MRCGYQVNSVASWLTHALPDFRSPKTADVARRVGLERILLETDHEDAALVLPSVESGIAFLADVFEVDRATVIDKTTNNAYQFYGVPTS